MEMSLECVNVREKPTRCLRSVNNLDKPFQFSSSKLLRTTVLIVIEEINPSANAINSSLVLEQILLLTTFPVRGDQHTIKEDSIHLGLLRGHIWVCDSKMFRVKVILTLYQMSGIMQLEELVNHVTSMDHIQMALDGIFIVFKRCQLSIPLNSITEGGSRLSHIPTALPRE